MRCLFGEIVRTVDLGGRLEWEGLGWEVGWWFV